MFKPRESWIRICGSLFLLLVLAACGPALTMQSRVEDHGGEPKVLVPQDRQKIGEGEDPLCPPAQKYCHKLRAEGQVPEGSFPFFGVEPVLASPMIWIQPLISARKDGTFSGLIHLGDQNKGAKEYFKIYVLACKDKNHFHEGEILTAAPEGCLMSDPVEVYRTR